MGLGIAARGRMDDHPDRVEQEALERMLRVLDPERLDQGHRPGGIVALQQERCLGQGNPEG